MRRKISLSDADIALWATVASRVKPLAGRKPVVVSVATSSAPPKHQPPPIPAPPKAGGGKAAAFLPVQAAPTPTVPKPLVPLERRLKQRLRRGREDISGVIDLHGMRQDEAHRALLTFVQRQQHIGATVVLVITGKGSMSPQGEERGLLRRVVPHWLSDPSVRRCVLGFENAADGHGGSGALYVRLRRRKDD